ncbi:GIY-YIG nuclease family protein [Ferrimonas marina]|uniref:GIY-YIG domain-containing protein n=1 Tax=Ferrimonas marina TaxID=299255 RepID=A0A1M5U0L2_9GAMM|nr:hypothetical protein [Ferrimonas marina]SHH56421.1 hypothetical protein SAMN02745129_2352 [Ferrimonas marina]
MQNSQHKLKTQRHSETSKPKRRYKPNGYWNDKARCQQEAYKYLNRHAFFKSSPGAYVSAKRNGWLDEITAHYQGYKPKGYWNDKARCQREADRFQTRTEFQKGSPSAHQAAKRNGWLEEMTQNYPNTIHPANYWTKERCWAEALQFQARKPFQVGSSSAYKAARLHGWLDDICSHMRRRGSLTKRMVYIAAFPNKVAYIGLTYNLQERSEAHLGTGDRSNKDSAVLSHIKSSGEQPTITPLSLYLDHELAATIEQATINHFRRAGWRLLNRQAGGGLGASIRRWDEETIRRTAKAYDSIQAFKEGALNAYNAASRMGILKELTQHMYSKIKRAGYWTKERCHQEALKYATRSLFMKGCPSAYSKAKQQGWNHEICSHMTSRHKPLGYWNDKALCQAEALKFTRHGDFQEGARGASAAAIRLGFYDEITTHMGPRRPRRAR